MLTLTSDNFETQVLEADRPVLVDFWADWCPPCKLIAPILDEISTEYADRLTVAKLNGDDHPDVVSRYGIMGFPTLILFRKGEPVQRITGAKPKRLLLADLADHF
ncbi:thioredoxin [Actinomadura adrarensis]|uniref:Thioredoxin n=1 Tax=Actinomadura adrarensis TaxID=1819600 RepID=A0ABW3CQ71_9ACTN